jgi:hypothetical protein
MLLGWCALGLACLGTLIHATGRTRRRTLARTNAVVLGFWLAGPMVLLPGPAHANDLEGAPTAAKSAESERPELGKPPTPGSFSPWEIDDHDPVESIPPPEKLHKDPLQFGYFVMDLSERADKATQRGDHAAAVKFWQALAKVTPDRSHAFARMCASYEAQGMLEKAAYSCGAPGPRSRITSAS